MLSHDRVLAQMCNWLRFLAQTRDTFRSADFATTILAKHRQVLLQEDSAQDMERLAADIDLFDQWFPFEVFKWFGHVPRTAGASARFLANNDCVAAKAAVHCARGGDNIARDEARSPREHLRPKARALSTLATFAGE